MSDQCSYSLATGRRDRTLQRANDTLVFTAGTEERGYLGDNPVDVHSNVVLLEKFEDTNIKLLQIVS